MPVGDDELDRLLRAIREDKALAVESIVAGVCPSGDLPHGYREMVGYVRGLDKALDLVRENFRAWFPEPARTTNTTHDGNY